MTQRTLNELKDKYEEGFRCIHAEKCDDIYTLHLKNFYSEKIEILETTNPNEISQIQDYLNCMEKAKENGGHDC